MNKKEIRKRLITNLKNNKNQKILITRSGLKEIKEWLESDRIKKFDVKHLQTNEKKNHWTEKINFDDMFEIIIEVYGSNPKQEKNWIKILEINNISGIEIDTSKYGGKKTKRDVVREIIKKVESKYNQEVNNTFREVEKLF